jgi:hypothetical protein
MKPIGKAKSLNVCYWRKADIHGVEWTSDKSALSLHCNISPALKSAFDTKRTLGRFAHNMKMMWTFNHGLGQPIGTHGRSSVPIDRPSLQKMGTFWGLPAVARRLRRAGF